MSSTLKYENVWTDKAKYEDAETQYYERLTKVYFEYIILNYFTFYIVGFFNTISGRSCES